MPFKMPTLGYWKTKGLAQPIRLLLTYAGEEFEDVQYEQGDAPDFSRESWYSVKPKMSETFSFPNLPYYIDGDVKITQCHAILRHVARKHSLDGETDEQKAEVDMLIEEANDMRYEVVKITYTSLENYEKWKPDYFKKVPAKLAQFEKHLGYKPWFTGNNITAADFSIYEIMDHHRRMQADSLDQCPHVRDFLDRFEALPRVKEYLALEKVQTLPVNSKIAAFK